MKDLEEVMNSNETSGVFGLYPVDNLQADKRERSFRYQLGSRRRWWIGGWKRGCSRNSIKMEEYPIEVSAKVVHKVNSSQNMLIRYEVRTFFQI